MKILKDILSEGVQVVGNIHVKIRAIKIDSRTIEKGDCFIAMPGMRVDGNTFIENAIQAGANSILCAQLPSILYDEVSYIVVKDVPTYAGILLKNFYDIDDTITLIGVTGTNGKTSVVTLLYELFKALGYKVGLISTIQIRVHEERRTTTHTTPNIADLYMTLGDMKQAGCRYVFMECSSHAIAQNRIAGLDFKVAVFTNITHEHLDYHKTFQAYIDTKKKWLDAMGKEATIIVNQDDPRASYMLQNTKAKKRSFALYRASDIKGKVLTNSFEGLHMLIDKYEVTTQLIGKFNAYNLLAVYAVGVVLGEDSQRILQILSSLKGAEGRFEVVHYQYPCHFVGIVDYAHTPDALEKILTTIDDIRGQRPIITVLGCGGNRDKEKRPLMMRIAFKYSKYVVVTADNPREEEEENIFHDMLQGITDKYMEGKVMIIKNRREAISMGVELAKEEGVLLIAGKGHEAYQEIKGVRIPFKDREVLEECMGVFTNNVANPS